MLGPHYMQRNHTTRTPTSVVFFDTESWVRLDPSNPKRKLNTLRLGVAVHVRLRKGKVIGRELYRFASGEDFLIWLRGKGSDHRPVWVYAHNLGYDLTQVGFWEALEAEDFTLRDPRPAHGATPDGKRFPKLRRGYAILEDPPTLIRCFSWPGHCFMLADTFNYWHTGLASMGEGISCPKLEMPSQEASDSDWYTYCERDVVIVERCVLGLMETVRSCDLGVWKGTAPALAMAAYKHRFMPATPRILIEPDGQSKRLARAAYYGGEVRVGFCGQVVPAEELGPADHYNPGKKPRTAGPVYMLDVTAAYPSVMREYKSPVRCESIEYDVSPQAALVLLEHFIGVAVVQICSVHETYPRRLDKDVEYVRGRFGTALCGAELRNALLRGDVERIACLALYVPGHIFTEYVDWFWRFRQGAKATGLIHEESAAKMMMNGLYGKFGQRSGGWKDLPDGPCPVPWGEFHAPHPVTGKPASYRSVGWNPQLQLEPGEHPESCPAIAACVTAALREEMRELRHQVGTGTVLYQDTDSLHVDIAGYTILMSKGLIGNGELGQLRLVGVAQRAEYRGPRNYSVDGVQVVAGLKGSAVQTGELTYAQQQFARIRSIIATRPDGTVRVDETTFTLLEGLACGVHLPNGRVYPRTVSVAGLTDELACALRPEEMPDDDSHG